MSSSSKPFLSPSRSLRNADLEESQRHPNYLRAKLAEMAKINYDLICKNNANFKRSTSEQILVEYVRDAYKKDGDTREAAEQYHEKAVDKNAPGGKKTNDCYRVMRHFSGLSITSFYMWLNGELTG